MALENHTFCSYSQWRDAYAWPALLQEDSVTPPSERLLQAVWFHQRLRRDDLRTTDGRAVRILHPGFWNREAGPDFRRAVVQWEGEPAREGDIEIDLHPGGWRAHGHATNPGYAGVILHVVWRSEGPDSFPTLALADQLETTLGRLERWHSTERAARWPVQLAGQCRVPLKALGAEDQMRLLREAAAARFQVKVSRMALRAAAVGWNQTLNEFLLRALGYKQNIWPMQRLGELVPLIHPGRETPEALLARFLGLAGLLPDALPIAVSDSTAYQRRLWSEWMQVRSALEPHGLPRNLWQLHHLRPANHPQRRLALAAHWISRGDLGPRVMEWMARDPGGRPSQWIGALRDAVGIPSDAFWENHWTFRAAPLDHPRPLLGNARLADLAVNVFLPWAWAGDSALRDEAERRYFSWPRTQDNALLRLARERLLSGDRPGCSLRTAAMQQGLLQVISDFCEHSDALCRGCPFPGWVEAWRH